MNIQDIITFDQSSNKIDRTMDQNEIGDVKPLSEEEVTKNSKLRKEILETHQEALSKNRNEYYKKREILMKSYLGKYIAFNHGNIVGVSDNPEEILKYIDEDSTTFTTCVGNEKRRSKTESILVQQNIIF